jgi:hypothetical protein
MRVSHQMPRCPTPCPMHNLQNRSFRYVVFLLKHPNAQRVSWNFAFSLLVVNTHFLSFAAKALIISSCSATLLPCPRAAFAATGFPSYATAALFRRSSSSFVIDIPVTGSKTSCRWEARRLRLLATSCGARLVVDVRSISLRFCSRQRGSRSSTVLLVSVFITRLGQRLFRTFLSLPFICCSNSSNGICCLQLGHSVV